MDNLRFEKELFSKNKSSSSLRLGSLKYIVGVDEVGRGCLAGPMVVGAVILDPNHLRRLIKLSNMSLLIPPRRDSASSYFSRSSSKKNDVSYLEITDSKKLSPNKRKRLSDFILKNAMCYSIKVINACTVDSKGLSKCTQIGFGGAVKKLKALPDHILTDAFAIKSLPKEVQTNIKRGDTLSISIAAASIIAKVYRDELMIKLHNNKRYQVYGFDRHKGYGTKYHLTALEKYGPCDLHRRSFAPVKLLI